MKKSVLLHKYIEKGICVALRYRNWKGEVSDRRFIPVWIYWGTTAFHPDAGWLVFAWDLDKNDWRTFALKGFREIE